MAPGIVVTSQSAGSGSADGPPQPVPANGRWFKTCPASANVNSDPGLNNALRCAPIWLPKAGTITGLGIYVPNVGTGDQTIRLGLYANSNGYPGALLVDGGVAYTAAAVAGFYPVTVSLAVAAATWAFAGAAWQGTTGTRPGPQGFQNLHWDLISHGVNPTVNPPNAFQQSSVAGALPDPFSSAENASWQGYAALVYAKYG